MSNSTTTIDQISASQSQKEVTANANFDAASPSFNFGRRASTCSGLTWGYNGATINVSGTPTQIAPGTIALTNNATNYLYYTSAGVVTKVTSAPTGWPGPITSPVGATALYVITTVSSLVTAYTDYRLSAGVPGITASDVYAGVSGAITVNGSGVATLSANNRITQISGFIDGAGGVIPTNSKSICVPCAFAGTIVAYTITVDTGTCTVKTWKKATGTAIPTVADVISTSGVAISTGTVIRSTTVSDFTTTSVAANDLFIFILTAVTGATTFSFTLEITRT